jgi:hypothetical protein
LLSRRIAIAVLACLAGCARTTPVVVVAEVPVPVVIVIPPPPPEPACDGIYMPEVRNSLCPPGGCPWRCITFPPRAR